MHGHMNLRIIKYVLSSVYSLCTIFLWTTMNLVFPLSVSKQVHSHFQSKLSAEGDLVLPLPIYSQASWNVMAQAQKPDFVFRRKGRTAASVQSTTGSRGMHINGSIAAYTMFRSSVKGTGYPLHSPVSPSLPQPSVTVCHHISTGVYLVFYLW